MIQLMVLMAHRHTLQKYIHMRIRGLAHMISNIFLKLLATLQGMNS